MFEYGSGRELFNVGKITCVLLVSVRFMKKLRCNFNRFCIDLMEWLPMNTSIKILHRWLYMHVHMHLEYLGILQVDSPEHLSQKKKKKSIGSLVLLIALKLVVINMFWWLLCLICWLFLLFILFCYFLGGIVWTWKAVLMSSHTGSKIRGQIHKSAEKTTYSCLVLCQYLANTGEIWVPVSLLHNTVSMLY